jgi:hypothetical protein
LIGPAIARDRKLGEKAEGQTRLNSAVTAKAASRQRSSTPSENLPQNHSLDKLAAPTPRISRRGSLFPVVVDDEVIVSSSRDPEYDACWELIRRGLRGVAAFRRFGALTPDLGMDIEREAQLMTNAWGVRVVKFGPDAASTTSSGIGEALFDQREPTACAGRWKRWTGGTNRGR